MRRSAPLAALALLLATLAAYAPYAGPRFVTGNADRDGIAYLTVLIDAVEQARAGVFPAYVGQSEARFNGGLYPQAQAPGFTFLAPIVDLLTLRRLGPIALLNLLLLAAALGGAGSMYAVLRRLDPRRPWTAAGLAFAYVACPGVIGVLVRLDMVTTFLTLPVLPWVWVSLLWAFEGDERRAGIGLGLSLAALVALHPPVALWAASTALVVGLAGLLLTRRGLRAACASALVFALAAAGPLVTAFALAGGRANTVGVAPGDAGAFLDPAMVAAVLNHARADFPAALLPVGWTPGGVVNGWPVKEHEALFLPASWRRGTVLPYLQLGCTLWLALALAAFVLLRAPARRRAGDRHLLALLAGAAFLTVFLFPVPGLTAAAWSALPAVFNVTKWWPAQRLYVVLASLAAPAGLLAWRAWADRATPAQRRWAGAVALLLVAWSAREAAKFSAWGLTRREPESVARLENLPLRAKDMQMSAPRRLPEFTDAAWHLRVVDAAGRVLLDNLDAARAACAAAEPLAPIDATLGRVRLVPGRRLVLCLRGGPMRGRLEAFADGFYRSLSTGVWRDAAGLDLLPLVTSGGAELEVNVRLLAPGGAPLPLGGTVAVAACERDTLPLRVRAWLPLTVDVPALPPGVTRPALETRRAWLAGYRARVDGGGVLPETSEAGLVQVPLDATPARVTLAYAPPPMVRAAFWVSAATWLLAALAGARRALRPRAA